MARERVQPAASTPIPKGAEDRVPNLGECSLICDVDGGKASHVRAFVVSQLDLHARGPVVGGELARAHSDRQSSVALPAQQAPGSEPRARPDLVDLPVSLGRLRAGTDTRNEACGEGLGDLTARAGRIHGPLTRDVGQQLHRYSSLCVRMMSLRSRAW